MADDRPRITRRDFLDGLKVVAAASLLPTCRHDRVVVPAFAPEREPGYYPPALTGMRGSHPGSFEVAHQLRDHASFGTPHDTGEHYDLVVVGAGISGLAAAYFYRKAHPGSSVLLLDNHDDVGGHAKRNEMRVGDRVLISNGGTAALEYPLQYSAVARGLLAELGVDLDRFQARFPAPPFEANKLESATFFDKASFGSDRLLKDGDETPSDAFLASVPVSERARHDLARLHRVPVDYWPTLSQAEKKHRLAKLSYRAFLVDVVKVAPDLVPLFQNRTHDLYGIGIDAVPALDCWALDFPGFDGMKLDRDPTAELGRTPALEMRGGPTWFHYPDGNASLVRLLVRALVPRALGGATYEDVVAARFDYATLDEYWNPTRIRLNSTVIHAGNDQGGVEVTYVRGGVTQRVRGNACVLACWNGVIPYMCPELSEPQRRALAYGVKVPLIYTNVALRNWRAFAKLGISGITYVDNYFANVLLELDATSARSPDEPVIVKLLRTPCLPGQPARAQHRMGRIDLLATPFDTFEHHVRDLLGRSLVEGGFDPERDIAAITVNRWSHGYSYEYNSLWDEAWPPGQEPCVIGRQRFGRIAIANADAGAYAYTDCAIDQARRAIDELVAAPVDR